MGTWLDPIIQSAKCESRVNDQRLITSRTVAKTLTNLFRMYFPLLSIGTAHFCLKGNLVVFFIFYSNFDRTFYMQIVETLIRRRDCTVCLCPTKKDAS